MKRKILSLLLLIIAISLFASPVNFQTAKNVAGSWYDHNFNSQPKFISTFASNYNGNAIYYVFNFKTGGFIIISADDNVTPIIAYDFQNIAPENVTDPAVKSYLLNVKKTISNVITSGISYPENQTLWQSVESGDFSDYTYTKDVSPLVSVTWDQGSPYNMYCPTENGQHTMVGCVAVAMAQIMKTNNYPVHGIGSHSYDWNGQTLSADFENTTYEWNLMPNVLNYGTPLNQRQAVATLLYHCGVATNMDYGVDGSGTYSNYAESAFKLYFAYDTYTVQLKNRSSFTDDVWIEMLKADLDDGYPVFYGGDDGSMGHAFVCDGYQGNNHFHFNWGWEGYYNGYFYLSNLNPMGYNFNQHQQAIFGIRPPEAPTPPQNLTAQVFNTDVMLVWESPSQKEIQGFNIYRDGELKDYLPGAQSISYYDMHLPDGSHSYYVTAVYEAGESEASNVVTVEIGASTDENSLISSPVSIKSIYPNPINISSAKSSSANVVYTLSKSTKVSIDIYNLKGEKVKTLFAGNKSAGTHTFEWNTNKILSKSGIYFYKLKAEGQREIIKKIIVIK